MRIAMVSEHASPLAALGGVDAGGQNVHVAELARAAARAGHEVEVWTRRDAPGLPRSVPFAPGVTVRHMDAGPAEPLPKDRLVPHVPRMAQVLEDAWVADPPDVVHAHFWMSGLAAMSAARRPGVPVVQTFHALGAVKRRHQGEDDSSPRGRVPAETALARRAARVIATCTDEAFELARLGVPRARVNIVPCGVDLEGFAPEGPVADRDPGAPRIVSIGRLVRRKGVDELIAALRRVPRARLVVAGGPPPAHLDADDDVRRLREVARRAGVADRVVFTGAVARDAVPALLRSADVVACVPWYEPFGMVPLEAMACGRAVVASAVGGLSDTVVDRVTGIHVPPRRPDLLGTALRDLLAAPAMVEAFGIAGRDRATSCYGWDRIAASVVGVYHQALDASTDAMTEGVAQ